MEKGVEEQGEVGIGGCEHGGAGVGVVEGGQGDHLACHILADLFLEFGILKLLDDIFSSCTIVQCQSTSILNIE